MPRKIGSITGASLPPHKWVPTPEGHWEGSRFVSPGCGICAFRSLEYKCSTIDCRPRNGVSVIAKLTGPQPNKT